MGRASPPPLASLPTAGTAGSSSQQYCPAYQIHIPVYRFQEDTIYKLRSNSIHSAVRPLSAVRSLSVTLFLNFKLRNDLPVSGLVKICVNKCDPKRTEVSLFYFANSLYLSLSIILISKYELIIIIYYDLVTAGRDIRPRDLPSCLH